MPLWIGGLLPSLDPLEGNLVTVEDLVEPFPADHNPAGGIVGELAGQLAQ